MRNTEREAYTKYLTERLDSGESQNIVIHTAADLITQKAEALGQVRVLDIGCFSGAMLNRIRNEISDTTRNRVEFVGVDTDEEALNLGRKKYQDLSLVSGDVDSDLEHLGSFDIAILSNVIHEAIPEASESNQDIETVALSILDNVAKLLNTGGNLIIMDGLRPENDQQLITVSFAKNGSSNLFKLFADRYQAFPISREKSPDGNYQTRTKDLAAFLTKARYLKEDYWNVESAQIYQFFTADQFISALQACGLATIRLEPQVFDRESLRNIISNVEPKIEMPAKNVLIVAQKTI